MNNPLVSIIVPVYNVQNSAVSYTHLTLPTIVHV